LCASLTIVTSTPGRLMLAVLAIRRCRIVFNELKLTMKFHSNTFHAFERSVKRTAPQVRRATFFKTPTNSELNKADHLEIIYRASRNVNKYILFTYYT